MSKNEIRRILVGEFVYIEKRGKKGVYCATWWKDKKHHRRTLDTRNKEEAIRRAQRLEAELTLGTEKPRRCPSSVKEAIDSYIGHKESEKRRRKTIVRYRGILDNLQAYLTQRKVERVDGIGTDDLVAYRKARQTKWGSTPVEKTLYTELVALKGFFKWCVEREFLEKSPAASLRAKKPRPPKRGGPNAKQLAEIIETARDSRRLHYATLIYTGMRSGELCNLRVEDVDLAGGWIHIVSRPGAETKNGESRKVPLHPHLKSMLANQRTVKGKPLFLSPSSKKYPQGDHKLNGKRLNEDFARLLNKLGMTAGRSEGYTIHSLRHSFFTVCTNAGIPPRAVAVWVGHSGDQSVGDNYYQLSDTESQRLIKRAPFIAPSSVKLPMGENEAKPRRSRF
jgi:integrase